MSASATQGGHKEQYTLQMSVLYSLPFYIRSPASQEGFEPRPKNAVLKKRVETSGYATWFTAGGAIRIPHYDVIDDVITRKL